jgi:hypothetical protein
MTPIFPIDIFIERAKRHVDLKGGSSLDVLVSPVEDVNGEFKLDRTFQLRNTDISIKDRYGSYGTHREAKQDGLPDTYNFLSNRFGDYVMGNQIFSFPKNGTSARLALERPSREGAPEGISVKFQTEGSDGYVPKN